MKTVGARREPQITEHPSGEALSIGARFSESVSRLAPSTFIPKGVYRFESHEAANKHQQDCLAREMGLLAARRSRERIDEPTGLGPRWRSGPHREPRGTVVDEADDEG